MFSHTWYSLDIDTWIIYSNIMYIVELLTFGGKGGYASILDMSFIFLECGFLFQVKFLLCVCPIFFGSKFTS
jgi:hypothetical protein